MKFLDQALRLVGTALGFSIFGIGGLIMGVIIFPLLFVFIRDRRRRKFAARWLIGRAFAGFLGVIRALRILDCRIDGLPHIDQQRNQLIVANHPTLIDVVLLLSLFPRANCVIKGAVTRNVFMRSVVRAADYISNDPLDELLPSCISYLDNGGSLMLFPEGTRSIPGEDLDFRPGAASVAVRTGVDVLPVAIKCTPLFLSKQLPWYFVPVTRPQFVIRILAPIPASEYAKVDGNVRATRHKLNGELLGRIRAELSSMEFS